jgi:chemotaxis response regulator CheB/chemotaxis methyl-accepting protein methylase
MVVSLTPEEREIVFGMIHRITGTCGRDNLRHEVIVANVSRRMQQIGCKTLAQYFTRITQDREELDYFISVGTIHTTSWFRELPHFRNLENWLRDKDRTNLKRFRMLVAACSTGEEAYSYACVLEAFRRSRTDFEYEITACDIDPISVAKAQAGVYRVDDFSPIPQPYRPFLVSRMRLGENHYIVDPEIQKRVKFKTNNILELNLGPVEKFDWISCRNVLIYFDQLQIKKIVANFAKVLRPEGRLVVGHCETIDGKPHQMKSVGNASYELPGRLTAQEVADQAPLRVLVVEDSTAVRNWLKKYLEEKGCSVVTATSVAEAHERAKDSVFDIVSLDIHLGDESGLDWLSKQRAMGLNKPVVLLTDVNAQEAPDVLKALEGLAEDYINKALIGLHPEELIDRLQAIAKSHRSRGKMPEKTAGSSNVHKVKSHLSIERPDLIVVGASTGGTDAMCKVLADLPKDCPPVVCVQHIPAEFAKTFHMRLLQVSGLKEGVIDRGKALMNGHLYIPTHDVHVGVRSTAGLISGYLSDSEKISSHRPSVDFLFNSAAHLRGKKVLAILLTGMGRDGAKGMLELKNAGATTMVQDEMSSVVWGMPGEAAKLGAAMVIGNVRELRHLLIDHISAKAAGTQAS